MIIKYIRFLFDKWFPSESVPNFSTYIPEFSSNIEKAGQLRLFCQHKRAISYAEKHRAIVKHVPTGLLVADKRRLVDKVD